MQKKIFLLQAVVPIVVLVFFLFLNVKIFDDTLAGANQWALLLASAVAVGIGLYNGVTYEGIIDKIKSNISTTVESIIILLFIGALAGSWLLSGVIPSMIYYGLNIFSPSIFLFATTIICAIISVATGSSWSTIATIGVAMLGIGQALGFSDGMIAGAVISGAYFGDKLSPMSDTTTLASAISGADLFVHIRYMLYTTIPSLVIALTVFLILGFTHDSAVSTGDIERIQSDLATIFDINLISLIIPAIVIYLIIKKVPTLATLFLGVIIALVYAFIFQLDLIRSLIENPAPTFIQYYEVAIQAVVGDQSIPTDNVKLQDLLSSSGMAGMLNTIWLIITAMIFGGIMEALGALQLISKLILKGAKSTFGLFATTTGTCLAFNLTTSDQYISIVVPGKMYADTFREKGLAPENLSRTLEDSATVTSVLIPWNTCGATQAGVLKVSVEQYALYAVFNYASPIMTLIFAFFHLKIKMLTNTKK